METTNWAPPQESDEVKIETLKRERDYYAVKYYGSVMLRKTVKIGIIAGLGALAYKAFNKKDDEGSES